MSISSTGLYGSATIVNSDLFNDVEDLKEQVTTLSTSYLQTTQEHREDISQNRLDRYSLIQLYINGVAFFMALSSFDTVVFSFSTMDFIVTSTTIHSIAGDGSALLYFSVMVSLNCCITDSLLP